MKGRGAAEKKNKSVGEDRSDERERRYRLARKQFLKLLKDGRKPADFYPALSPGTFKRILDGSAVGDIQKDRLIELIDGGISTSAYRALATAIGQHSKDRKDVGDSLRGNYHYFRHNDPMSGEKGVLGEGRITIIAAPNGDVTFSHWPPGSALDDAPEHVGFIFRVDSKLFMLGWKTGSLRLGIAHCSDDSTGIMSGYVLSVRSGGGTHPIFAAASILVREDKTELIEGFRSDEGLELFKQHHTSHRADFLEG